MSNDCYISEWDYHPTLEQVIATNTAQYMGDLGGALADNTSYDRMLYPFLWKYADRRMRVHAAIDESGVYPAEAWTAFINQVQYIAYEQYPLLTQNEADRPALLNDWTNGARKLTNKQYAAPNGTPSTAYVEAMQTQEEDNADHKSPDDIERRESMRSARDLYLDHFSGLFLGVLQ